MKTQTILLSIVLAVAMAGCASTKVERVDVDKQIDLSGGWNDTDATLATQALVQDCLKGVWHIRYVLKENKDPVVIVGHIANRSYEHINIDVIVKGIEQELVNSGKVIFVASSEERQEVRAERKDQKEGGYTDPDTISEWGKEAGADYMLIGSVNSMKDEVKGKFAVYYQVNLELIDLETNAKVWIGQKEIKKLVKTSKMSL